LVRTLVNASTLNKWGFCNEFASVKSPVSLKTDRMATVPGRGGVGTNRRSHTASAPRILIDKFSKAFVSSRTLSRFSCDRSNVGYMFIREAIEEASGLPLASALEELVRSNTESVQTIRRAFSDFQNPKLFNRDRDVVALVTWPAAIRIWNRKPPTSSVCT